MSSASEFYEADSGNLVSRQPGLAPAFGAGCLSYYTTEFQSLQTRYGAERFLLRNCNFVRNIATASAKGLIETFADSTVKGFACKYGQEASVDVEIFLGGASGVGIFAGRTKANLAPADETDRQNLAKQCSTAAALHRFSFVIPEALRTQNPGKAIFVHAIDAAASDKNFSIGNSGALLIPGAPSVKRIFVSSESYTGNLGGIQGADSKCQGLAITAGLSGNWIALLGGGGVTGRDRLPVGAISDMKGKNIFGTTSENPFWSLSDVPRANFNEKGELVSAAPVWTNLYWKTGEIVGVAICNNWTISVGGGSSISGSYLYGPSQIWVTGGFAGINDAGKGLWAAASWGPDKNESTLICSNKARIYCVEK
ncbi:MAG: hypothetical protein WCI18_15515 [Pseudomonadota bacterium]